MANGTALPPAGVCTELGVLAANYDTARREADPRLVIVEAVLIATGDAEQRPALPPVAMRASASVEAPNASSRKVR